MLMLEPSPENPLNMEAYSYFLSQSDTFDQLVQKSISGGCGISGVKFESVLTPTSSEFGYPTSSTMMRSALSPSANSRSTDRAGAMSPISNHVFTQRLGKQGSSSTSQMEDSSVGDESTPFGSIQGYQPALYGSNLSAPRSVSGDSNASSSSVASRSFFMGQAAATQLQQIPYSQATNQPNNAQILAPHRSQQGKKRCFEESDNEVCGPLEPMRNPFHVFPLHLNRSNSNSSGYNNSNSSDTTPRGISLGVGQHQHRYELADKMCYL